MTPDVAWSVLVAQASRHGVAPIVHGHLRTLGTDRTPPEALDALAGAARACVALNLRLRDELSRLLAAFSRAGIPALPLKGPVLADRLYPAPLLRTAGDLDVLVPAADVLRAGRALEAIGYARSPDAEQGADYHTIYMREAGAVVVELHHDVGERHVSGLDARALWRAATRTSWRGQPVWEMALPDLLLYLAFHAVKDGLASLRALVDITLLVERHRDELPWAALAARATAAHLGPAVYLALGQARGLLGAPVLIVHVSGGEASKTIRAAQTLGARVFAETCPQYLFLKGDDADKPALEGAKWCCSPPPRDAASQEAVWQGLKDGTFQVGKDGVMAKCPSKYEAKPGAGSAGTE